MQIQIKRGEAARAGVPVMVLSRTSDGGLGNGLLSSDSSSNWYGSQHNCESLHPTEAEQVKTTATIAC